MHVYVAHSITDKTLKDVFPIRKFEIPIQVGAILTDKKIFSIRDDQGENISEKIVNIVNSLRYTGFGKMINLSMQG